MSSLTASSSNLYCWPLLLTSRKPPTCSFSLPSSLKTCFSLMPSPPVASFCHFCPHPLLSPQVFLSPFSLLSFHAAFNPQVPFCQPLLYFQYVCLQMRGKLWLSLHLPSHGASSQLPPRPPVNLPVTWPTYISSFSIFLLFYGQLISQCVWTSLKKTQKYTQNTHLSVCVTFFRCDLSIATDPGPGWPVKIKTINSYYQDKSGGETCSK